MFAHAYGGVPMDVEAETGGSRWKRHLACRIRGFAALARGDRAGAIRWFKADEHIPIDLGGRPWGEAVRERVLADGPVWPPWLAGKK